MKHRMKQLLAMLLTLSLLLSLAACAEHETVSESHKALAGETVSGFRSETPAPTAADSTNLAISDFHTESMEKATVDEGAPAAVYSGGEGSASDKAASLGATGAPGDGSGAEGTVLPGDFPLGLTLPAEPLKLTAAEWKDNDNWPFFTNLVNTEVISFPSYGLDPRHRLEVQVQQADGTPLVNGIVRLTDAAESLLWQCRTNKEGRAFVFWTAGQTPAYVRCDTAEAPVQIPQANTDIQSQTLFSPLEAITLQVSGETGPMNGMQIMFIVDTTGSMSDEIAYLQKDFSAIAGRVGSEGVRWSANFYRDEGDEYVTRTNGFTADVDAVQAKINDEYAAGGGDTPEAVAEILTECLVEQAEWEETAVKLAFLIFDAPPHEGKEAELLAAVHAAAAKGIRLIPVVASNADRDTELFGRSLAILTGGSYVFLTDDSGIGESHLEPIVGSYEVELLQDLIVRIIDENRP